MRWIWPGVHDTQDDQEKLATTVLGTLHEVAKAPKPELPRGLSALALRLCEGAGLEHENYAWGTAFSTRQSSRCN